MQRRQRLSVCNCCFILCKRAAAIGPFSLEFGFVQIQLVFISNVQANVHELGLDFCGSSLCKWPHHAVECRCRSCPFLRDLLRDTGETSKLLRIELNVQSLGYYFVWCAQFGCPPPHIEFTCFFLFSPFSWVWKMAIKMEQIPIRNGVEGDF